MCMHGDEAGKCDICYDVWKATGTCPPPVMTFGQYDKIRKDKLWAPFDELVQSVIE